MVVVGNVDFSQNTFMSKLHKTCATYFYNLLISTINVGLSNDKFVNSLDKLL